MTVTLEQAQAAKESAKKLLAAVPGVVGVGITQVGEDYAVKVNLRTALPAGTALPKEVGGVRLVTEVVGAIKKRG